MILWYSKTGLGNINWSHFPPRFKLPIEPYNINDLINYILAYFVKT